MVGGLFQEILVKYDLIEYSVHFAYQPTCFPNDLQLSTSVATMFNHDLRVKRTEHEQAKSDGLFDAYTMYCIMSF